MSFFGITVETIKTIETIPGADRLQKASLFGMDFSFCIPVNMFIEGERVLYFPIDSVLPQTIQEKLGVVGKLAGSNKDRIKTIKLKSTLSQGIVGKLDTFESFFVEKFGNSWFDNITPIEITQTLGVIKYEPPEVVCKAGRLVALPHGVAVYDIEGCDRFPAVVDRLMDMPVYISEKVEGSNFSMLRNSDGILHFCQRRFEVKPEPDTDAVHDWIRVPIEAKLPEVLARMEKELYPGTSITIRGEIAGPGVQGNIYKLQKIELFIFDIQVNGKYLAGKDFLRVCDAYNLQIVPSVAINKTLREWLGGKTVQQASNGESALFKTLREGIVIKPYLQELHDEALGGRLIIKQRDPIYLDKSKLS